MATMKEGPVKGSVAGAPTGIIALVAAAIVLGAPLQGCGEARDPEPAVEDAPDPEPVGEEARVPALGRGARRGVDVRGLARAFVEELVW